MPQLERILLIDSGQRPEIMLNISQFTGQSAKYTKKYQYLAPNVNCAEVEKLCFLR